MRRKNIKKIINISIIAFIIIIIMTQFCFALDTTTYTGIYEKPEGIDTLTNKGGKILGVVQAVGTSISVISLIIIGVIYMTASPDKKSELKQRLILFTIGAIILFAAANIMSIVANFGMSFNK